MNIHADEREKTPGVFFFNGLLPRTVRTGQRFPGASFEMLAMPPELARRPSSASREKRRRRFPAEGSQTTFFEQCTRCRVLFRERLPALFFHLAAGRPAGGKTGRALAERRGVPRVSSFPTAGHQDGAAESGSKQLVPDRAGLRAGRTTSPPKSGAETIGYGPGIPARPPSLASSAAGRERRQSRGPLFRTLRNKSVIGSRRAA